MERNSVLTEVIVLPERRSLGAIALDGKPQPGHQFALDGQSYLVLERRHRYQYRQGGYQLQTMSVDVQVVAAAAGSTAVAWIGDGTCQYNARSPLLRCAVNPVGPCAGCVDYTVRRSEAKRDS